jgi:hypothetical protein
MPARALAACVLALALLTAPAALGAAKKPKPLDGTSVITFKGVGPIKLGMTLKEARKAARTGIVAGPEVTKDCRQDTVLPKRFGLGTLRFKGKIRVLYITRTALPTAKGVRVNDSLERLRSKYGSALQERPSDVSETTRIFELHQGTREIQFSVGVNDAGQSDRIIQIATGLRPEVDFSEGCA